MKFIYGLIQATRVNSHGQFTTFAGAAADGFNWCLASFLVAQKYLKVNI